jgi:hypothetical protein
MLFTHGRGSGLARSFKICEYDLRGNGGLALTAMPYEVEFLQDCLGSDRATRQVNVLGRHEKGEQHR